MAVSRSTSYDDTDTHRETSVSYHGWPSNRKTVPSYRALFDACVRSHLSTIVKSLNWSAFIVVWRPQDDYKTKFTLESLIYLITKEVCHFTVHPTSPKLKAALIECHWYSIWPPHSRIKSCNRFSKCIRKLIRVSWLIFFISVVVLRFKLHLDRQRSPMLLILKKSHEKKVQLG